MKVRCCVIIGASILPTNTHLLTELEDTCFDLYAAFTFRTKYSDSLHVYTLWTIKLQRDTFKWLQPECHLTVWEADSFGCEDHSTCISGVSLEEPMATRQLEQQLLRGFCVCWPNYPIIQDWCGWSWSDGGVSFGKEIVARLWSCFNYALSSVFLS